MKVCSVCRGAGTIKVHGGPNTISGTKPTQITCPKCGGRGYEN